MCCRLSDLSHEQEVVFGAVIKLWVRILVPQASSIFDSSSPLMYTLGGSGDGSSNWASALPEGDLD